MRWLKKGFSHCFILSCNNGEWYKHEYGHGVFRIDMLSEYEVQHIRESCIIIKHAKSDVRVKWFINDCVGFVKASLLDGNVPVGTWEE